MLAPISTSSYQESSIIRNQQHYSTKLPIKLRKSHDIDSNQHKITRKDEDYTHRLHVSSPMVLQRDKSNINQSSKDFRLKKNKNYFLKFILSSG